MANLEALPNELLARIISLSDRKSLAQLRLANRKLEQIAVGKLFERVTLYAHWLAEDRGDYVDSEESRDVFWKEGGLIADSDNENDADYRNSTKDRDQEAEDDFIAGSDLEGDKSSELGVTQDFPRRPRGASRVGDAETDSPTRPDLFDGRLSEFNLYERQRQEKRKAGRPKWAQKGFPGPSSYDANLFKQILENKTLRKYVKIVQIYTCETHCDHHPKTGNDLFKDSWPLPSFHPVYEECVKRLGEFPNLCGVTVHFDRHVDGSYDDDTFQSDDFQPVWLERIATSINHTMSGLAVRHYQNTQSEVEEIETPEFFKSLVTASSLRLSVKHEETHPGGGSTYRVGNIHPFWETFPTRFLLPVSNTLNTLVLYSDIPVGWFPKLDLRNVYFPKLASLTLGHHVFHHDHQIDWIVSQRDTLRELILDRCSILYQIGCCIPRWLDDDGYPRKQPPGHNAQDYGISVDLSGDDDDASEWEDDLLFKSNTLRWHNIFSRFTSELTNLHTFRFGMSTQWNFNTGTRHFRAGASTHMPIIPWEDEHNIENKLFKERYVIWDDWNNDYYPRWIISDGCLRDGITDEEDRWLTSLDDYPKCESEDEAALQTLLQTVKGR